MQRSMNAKTKAAGMRDLILYVFVGELIVFLDLEKCHETMKCINKYISLTNQHSQSLLNNLVWGGLSPRVNFIDSLIKALTCNQHIGNASHTVLTVINALSFCSYRQVDWAVMNISNYDNDETCTESTTPFPHGLIVHIMPGYGLEKQQII